MIEFRSVDKVWYGNTESGEIVEIPIQEKKSVRGGYEYVTERGNFLSSVKGSHSFIGNDIFSTSKEDVIRTMNEYVWGMSDEALRLFNENKDGK